MVHTKKHLHPPSLPLSSLSSSEEEEEDDDDVLDQQTMAQHGRAKQMIFGRGKQLPASAAPPPPPPPSRGGGGSFAREYHLTSCVCDPRALWALVWGGGVPPFSFLYLPPTPPPNPISTPPPHPESFPDLYILTTPPPSPHSFPGGSRNGREMRTNPVTRAAAAVESTHKSYDDFTHRGTNIGCQKNTMHCPVLRVNPKQCLLVFSHYWMM